MNRQQEQTHTHKKHHSGIGHRHDTGGSAIDFYACNSRIRHWHPGFKTGFSMLMLLFCIFADNPWISCILIAASAIITVALGGLSIRQYLSVLTIPAAFIFLGSIAVAVDFSREPAGNYNLYLYWGYLYLTRAGIQKTVFLILKVFGAVSCMFIVELMHMIYRYIFILLEVQRKMRISAESRLGFCDFKTSCYSFGQIASNLFIVALKKANAYYDAMEARCYDGTFAFLEEEKKLKPMQLLAAGIFFTFLIAVWILTSGRI